MLTRQGSSQRAGPGGQTRLPRVGGEVSMLGAATSARAHHLSHPRRTIHFLISTATNTTALALKARSNCVPERATV